MLIISIVQALSTVDSGQQAGRLPGRQSDRQTVVANAKCVNYGRTMRRMRNLAIRMYCNFVGKCMP